MEGQHLVEEYVLVLMTYVESKVVPHQTVLNHTWPRYKPTGGVTLDHNFFTYQNGRLNTEHVNLGFENYARCTWELCRISRVQHSCPCLVSNASNIQSAYIYIYISVQIWAGPAEERGRVCRCNEPSDEVAFLNLRTSGFFLSWN